MWDKYTGYQIPSWYGKLCVCNRYTNREDTFIGDSRKQLNKNGGLAESGLLHFFAKEAGESPTGSNPVPSALGPLAQR